jgi:hypothetical protein
VIAGEDNDEDLSGSVFNKGVCLAVDTGKRKVGRSRPDGKSRMFIFFFGYTERSYESECKEK